MKFFTIEWWSGDIDQDHMAVFDDYRKHIERITPDLTDVHHRLLKDVSLHDSHLLMLSADYEAESVTLDLDGSGFDESTKSYFGRRFKLIYKDVQSLLSTSDPEKGLPGPNGYGDLGYDEIHLLAPGLFEHRMLFSSGIVLSIRHRQFILEFSDSKPIKADQGADGDAEEAV